MTLKSSHESHARRRLFVVSAATVVIAVVVALLATWLKTAPPSRSAPIQARLELAAGEVLLVDGDQSQRLISGTPLRENAELKTAAGARALIRLPDGGKAFLRGGTHVLLGQDSVELKQGEYWLEAPPSERKPIIHRHRKTEVSASDAGLSVRAMQGSTTVYVARGMAIVSGPAGRVEVQAGEQVTLGEGQKPNVEAVAFWQDWTGGMADFDSGMTLTAPGSGTLYGVDNARAGVKPTRLEIARQTVRAVVREGVSETEVDQTFFNPAERDVEGWYWFTIPSSASITSFSVETEGTLVEGEFIERRQAAANYGQAKSSGHSPAILEWIDRDTYRAKIFPVPAGGTRRVLVRYIELTPVVEGRLSYVYPMGSGAPARIGEFALNADLGEEGPKMKLTTLAEARIEENGKRVTLRRSGFTPRTPFQLEAILPSRPEPLRVARFEAGSDTADYLMARYVPDIDWESLPAPPGDVVVVVDTSAAGDENERQLKVTAAEAILRALSEDDHFALITLDATATVLHPSKGLAPAKDTEISQALNALANHASGGATDLAAIFDVALERLHKRPQPAVVYVGDGVATSGVLAPEQLLERLRRALGSSQARLFTVGVGSEADHPLLRELARVGGGNSMRIDRSEQATSRALELAAKLKTPTLTDLEIDLGAGLDEPFFSTEGPLSRGQEIILLARTHHQLPNMAKVSFKIAGKSQSREYSIETDKSVAAAFVPRLWASEQIRRLLGSERGIDAERGKVAAIGIEYGLMTPFTSILALESEDAYARMGIQRRTSPLRGITLTQLLPVQERAMVTRLAAWASPVGVGFGCSNLESDEGSAAEAPPLPVAPQAVESKAEATTPLMAAPRSVDRTADQAPAPAPIEGEAVELERAPEPSLGFPNNPRGGDGLIDSASGDDRPGSVQAEPLLRLQARRTKSAGRAADRPSPAMSANPACACAPGDPLCSCIENKDEAAGPRNAQGVDLEGLKRQIEKEAPVAPVPPPSFGVCSDAASRPLWDRAVLWRQRFSASTDESGLIERYESARRACELQDWQAERVFFILMQRSIKRPSGARLVLEHFAGRPEVQKYLAKLVLRRTVDPKLAEAIRAELFGTSVDWVNLDLALEAVADKNVRIEKLREAVSRAPDDTQGTMRLVRALIEGDQVEAAVALSRQLRDNGLVTPTLARELGDVLARAGLNEESARTYSEIVEFDADDQASRRLLGDVYLAHHWYDRAYSQYSTLTEALPDDSLAWLRLAAAAAGAGRIDEALRLERRVAGAQGSPGPKDPRRWARLASAARLAKLLASAAKGAGSASQPPPEALERKLRELQLFNGPGTLDLLAWEDLFAELRLETRAEGKLSQLGTTTDASPIGLYATLLSPADTVAAKVAIQLRSMPGTLSLPCEYLRIVWDGKSFKVARRAVTLAPGATELLL